MASIIGGIGTSHVPTIGLAFDRRLSSSARAMVRNLNWRALIRYGVSF